MGGGKGLPGGEGVYVGKHRAPRGPEVVRHRRRMHPSDRAGLLVGGLVLALLAGILGYLLVTIPHHGPATLP